MFCSSPRASLSDPLKLFLKVMSDLKLKFKFKYVNTNVNVNLQFLSLYFGSEMELLSRKFRNHFQPPGQCPSFPLSARFCNPCCPEKFSWVGQRIPQISWISFGSRFKPLEFHTSGGWREKRQRFGFWRNISGWIPLLLPFLSSPPSQPIQTQGALSSLEITNWNKLHFNSKQAKKWPHWCQLLDKY